MLAFSWIGVGVQLLEDADGAIHTASPGDATTAGLESAVVDAVIDAFAGTGAAKARAELGWSPSHPSLADEFRHGSYRQ